MKINKTRAALYSALCIMNCASFTACSSDDNSGSESAKYITVSPSIGSMTRTEIKDGTQVFEKDDQISVYAWTGTATAVGSLVVNNAINTYDGTSAWTAAPQMLWQDMTSAHYFLSVYPTRAITDFTADPYTLDVNAQEASDLLVATNLTGLTATNNPVSLTFNHVMAKLIVNLTFRNQWGGTPTVSAVNATAKSAATVDYISATATASGDQAAISLPATTTNTNYASIMVPQTGFNTIGIVINGKTYTFTYTNTEGNVTDIPLEAGKYTTVNLIVGRNQIDLGSVSINDWAKGETINNGEAQTN